jgi:hypothetical protein
VLFRKWIRGRGIKYEGEYMKMNYEFM